MSWQAASGLRTWLIQRLSAVYIAVFVIIFAGAWVGETVTYEVWRSWVARPLVNISLILFILAMIIHAWIGVRDVVMDYFSAVFMRYLLLIGFGLMFISMGFWVLRTLILVTSV